MGTTYIIGGRKFFGTMFVLIMAVIALSVDKITGGEWVTINTLALGIFGGSNVWQKKNEDHNSR